MNKNNWAEGVDYIFDTDDALGLNPQQQTYTYMYAYIST